MKMRSKVLAGLTATVLALSTMIGSALAAQNEVPGVWADTATADGGGEYQGEGYSGNHVWVTLCGGGTAISDPETANKCKSFRCYFDGDCTADITMISNTEKGDGWSAKDYPATVIDGETILERNFGGSKAVASGWVEACVSIWNKTEGALSLNKMEFLDADGNVLLTWPAADAAPAADATLPKTGVVSAAIVLGLGASMVGAGATLLKKKED